MAHNQDDLISSSPTSLNGRVEMRLKSWAWNPDWNLEIKCKVVENVCLLLVSSQIFHKFESVIHFVSRYPSYLPLPSRDALATFSLPDFSVNRDVTALAKKNLYGSFQNFSIFNLISFWLWLWQPYATQLNGITLILN